jgi:hypothetical protein
MLPFFISGQYGVVLLTALLSLFQIGSTPEKFPKKIQIKVPSYIDETRRNMDEGALDNDNTPLLLDEWMLPQQ